MSFAAKKVFIKNLGCKVNLADGHGLAYEFQSMGYGITEDPRQAHITVLNTCSVTHKAEKEVRYLLRRYNAENPHGMRVVTGCYAQIDSHTLLQMPEVSYVIPNEVKGELVSLIHKSFHRKHPADSPFQGKFPRHICSVQSNRQAQFKSATAFFAPHLSDRTRAFLKIQDGCNDFCAYCQIPYARGSSRSIPSGAVAGEVKRLLESGVAEIVLTGIHIGEWGKDLTTRPSIVSLLQIITPLLATHSARLRLSSLEPSEFRQPLAKWMTDHHQLICHHLHFPLQSGSQRILKRMGRRYTPQEYCDALQRARQAFAPSSPHLSADVMVGFPGESEKDFEATYDLIQTCQLNSLHVFPYSKRPHTRALKFDDHLPGHIIRQRSKVLRELSERRLQDFYRGSIGQICEVLWENKCDDQGRRLGKTSHYLTVCAPQGYDPGAGSLSRMRLKGLISARRLLATPLSQAAEAEGGGLH